MDINTITMTGKMVNDPVFQLTEPERPVCTFTISVNNHPAHGPQRFNVICFGGCANYIANKLSADDRVTVTGSLRSREVYDKNDRLISECDIRAIRIVIYKTQPREIADQEEELLCELSD